MPESTLIEGWYIKMVGTNRIWTTCKNPMGQCVPVVFDTCAVAQHHIDRHTKDRKKRERDLCKRLDWHEYGPIEIKEYIEKYGAVSGSGFVR